MKGPTAPAVWDDFLGSVGKHMARKVLLQADARWLALCSIHYSFYVTGGRRPRFFARIKDEEEKKTVTLGERLDTAYRTYMLLVENEVAPCHVFDIMEDLDLA